jgi:hypothetical protein
MMNIHRVVAAGAAVSLIATLGFAQRFSARVHLKSTDYRRSSKRVVNRGVRLVRQQSKSACVQGRSWGYNRNTIWVSRGCEADFEYIPRRGRG